MDKDHQYSIDLLRRVNNLSVSGRPIYEHFQYGDCSLWSFQQFQLWNDTKMFTSAGADFDKFSLNLHWVSSLDRLFNLIFQIASFFLGSIFFVKLVVCRVKVICYSPDKLKTGTQMDPRLFRIYEILNKRGIMYGEIIHTLFGREFVQNFFTRKRSVFYLEVVVFIYRFIPYQKKQSDFLDLIKTISLNGFNENEKPFVSFLLRKYAIECFMSEFLVKFFHGLFKKTSLSTFFSIDDFRYYHELILACRLSGIKTYVFQHSNFDYLLNLDTLPPSFYVFPDSFFLWNEYWLYRIAEISPLFNFYKDKIYIGGRSGGLSRIKYPVPTDKDEYLTILLPYEMNLKKNEVYKYVEEMLRCTSVRIIFKVRPDISIERQIAEYNFANFVKNGKLAVKTSLDERDMRTIDLAVGVYTTLLDEMVEQEKPVAILQTSYVAFNDLAKGGMARIVDRSIPDLCGQLLLAANRNPMELKSLRNIFINNTGDIDQTINNILSETSIM